MPLMSETTNARSARFLTMPSVVEYCGVIHCRAFASLSILYGTLDSILFIALCSNENSSSPPHLIMGNHIPVCHIDRKLYHGRFTLVFDAKLGSSNFTCSPRQFLIYYLGILELSMRATCPNHLRCRDRRVGYSD